MWVSVGLVLGSAASNWVIFINELTKILQLGEPLELEWMRSPGAAGGPLQPPDHNWGINWIPRVCELKRQGSVCQSRSFRFSFPSLQSSLSRFILILLTPTIITTGELVLPEMARTSERWKDVHFFVNILRCEAEFHNPLKSFAYYHKPTFGGGQSFNVLPQRTA